MRDRDVEDFIVMVVESSCRVAVSQFEVVECGWNVQCDEGDISDERMNEIMVLLLLENGGISPNCNPTSTTAVWWIYPGNESRPRTTPGVGNIKLWALKVPGRHLEPSTQSK